MSKRVICVARSQINFGARVLIRANFAEPAGPEIANGTALASPMPTDRPYYRKGEGLTAIMDDGLGARDLQAIANGPIMDSCALYLPAGKLSLAETICRERQAILPDATP